MQEGVSFPSTNMRKELRSPTARGLILGDLLNSQRRRKVYLISTGHKKGADLILKMLSLNYLQGRGPIIIKDSILYPHKGIFEKLPGFTKVEGRLFKGEKEESRFIIGERVSAESKVRN